MVTAWATLQLYVQVVLVFVFLQSLVTKIKNVPDFQKAVRNYRLLPPALVPAFSLMTMGFEGAVVLLLTQPQTYLAGLIGSLTLLLVFSGALASTVYRRLDVSCGCFGQASSTATTSLARNGVLASLGLLALLGGLNGPYTFSALLFLLILPLGAVTAWGLTQAETVRSVIRLALFRE